MRLEIRYKKHAIISKIKNCYTKKFETQTRFQRDPRLNLE